MEYDYFLAARYRNKDEAIRLTQNLRSLGQSVYCFAESRASLAHVGPIDSDGETAMRQFEGRAHNDSGIIDVFKTDLAAEKLSANFILLLPAGTSCHIEAGIAYGLGKHLILIGQPEKTESLYHIFTKRYDTQEAFLEDLRAQLN